MIYSLTSQPKHLDQYLFPQSGSRSQRGTACDQQDYAEYRDCKSDRTEDAIHCSLAPVSALIYHINLLHGEICCGCRSCTQLERSVVASNSPSSSGASLQSAEPIGGVGIKPVF